MKALLCDICGKAIDIRHKRIKYKVDKYDIYTDQRYGWWEGWARIDICEECFDKMIGYIKGQRGA